MTTTERPTTTEPLPAWLNLDTLVSAGLREDLTALYDEGAPIVAAVNGWIRRVWKYERLIENQATVASESLHRIEANTGEKFDSHVYDGLRCLVGALSGLERVRDLVLDVGNSVECFEQVEWADEVPSS